jgi:hypothetical protein
MCPECAPSPADSEQDELLSEHGRELPAAGLAGGLADGGAQGDEPAQGVPVQQRQQAGSARALPPIHPGAGPVGVAGDALGGPECGGLAHVGLPCWTAAGRPLAPLRARGTALREAQRQAPSRRQPADRKCGEHIPRTELVVGA